MPLSSQLKRGYIALAGLAALGMMTILSPEFAALQKQLTLPELAKHACEKSKNTSWRLASTPIDIQPILIRKAMLCRA